MTTSHQRIRAGFSLALLCASVSGNQMRRLTAPSANVAIAIVLAASFALAVDPAYSDGGAGGNGGGGAAGGAGATGAGGTAGGDGNAGVGVDGGGGGGGGSAGGGAGGTGGSGGSGAGGGGGGGSAAGAAGSAGAVDLGGGGGGGGGGGANGSSAASLPGGVLIGGTGGVGGAGGASSGIGNGGGGGGGGSGGTGAVVTGGSANVNAVAITGGLGGVGGAGGAAATGIGGDGGTGGGGGAGITFAAPGASLVNSGSIQGGDGASGGAAGASGGQSGISGPGGIGGVGVVGGTLSIVNSGAISGGFASDGITRANAILFTGGINSLTLQSGSTINGNVIAVNGGTDTFALGGAFDSSFNTTLIGTQFQNFTVFNKTETSVWTLTGTPGQDTPWVISDGTLQADAATNVFGATSAITVNAPGFLDLGGNNQQIGSLSGSGNVTNTGLSGAVLTTGDAGSTSFSGVIQDGTSATGLTKQGTGTFTLSGINTYTGATTVNAGTLEVDGSVALSSGLTVSAGGTLAGTGIVASTTINGGTLSPGDGVGTITVAGNLAFTAGSTYLVDVSPTTSDRTDVSGTASLNGTTQATFEVGSYIERTYTILSATGGRSGVFDSLTTTGLPAGFSASLSYNATDAILNLTATLGPPGGSGQMPRNPANVATTLNNFFNNGGTLPPNFVTVFGLTGTDLREALNQLSGEAATGIQQGAFQLSSQFLELMLDPFVDERRGLPDASGSGRALDYLPERAARHANEPVLKGSIYKPTQRWSVWGGAFGSYNRTDGDLAVMDSHDLRSQAGGVAVGLDYRLSPDTVAGFALAGGATDWHLAGGLGGGKSDAFQAGIYGATRTGPAYLATAFAYANHWMSADRFAFGDNHLGASFNAHSFGARLEGGYRVGDAASAVAPYVALQALRFLTPSYAETDFDGGGFGLNYASHTANSIRSELGTRFDYVMQHSEDAALVLRGKIAWAHDWVSDPTRVVAFQGLSGSGTFVVTGASPAQNSLLVSVGPELRFANGITIAGKFDGEFSGRSNTYAGTGTLRVRW